MYFLCENDYFYITGGTVYQVVLKPVVKLLQTYALSFY